MRRSLPVLAATAGGLALLANFHTASRPLHLGTLPASGAASIPTTSSTTDQPDTTSSSVADPAAAPSPSTSTVRRPTATAPATTASAGRTLSGPVIRTEYGPVQVQVKMQGRQIIDVEALQLPSDRSKSRRISQEAGPILRSEALQAQSANIDLVSGASFTSDGYARSLQGALDQAAP